VSEGVRSQIAFGANDVLQLTLRELAAFDAEVIELGALQDYFRALADFRAAVGVGGK
jgi:hypothetical protein